MTRSSQFLEYMKLHLISLEQDQDELTKTMTNLDENSKDYQELDFEYNWLNGQITATNHLLSVATDIMNSTNERYNNDNI